MVRVNEAGQKDRLSFASCRGPACDEERAADKEKRDTGGKQRGGAGAQVEHHIAKCHAAQRKNLAVARDCPVLAPCADRGAEGPVIDEPCLEGR